MAVKELTVKLRSTEGHPHQAAFIESKAKRKVVRAGRRSGKTTGVAILAVSRFLDGHRVLYAAPTQDQTDKFWLEVTNALSEPIKAGVYYINQTRRFIERSGTENRIRAKTAWDANSMRGDYADELIFEEYQLMDPDAWNEVGAPMLLDNNGNATFIYTPPKPGDKVKGPHASKLFKRAQADTTGRYEAFHFTSLDNPHLSQEALDEISEDMSPLAYKREILAMDIDQNPDALWDLELIENTRWTEGCPDLGYVVVGVDPPAKQGRCGIVVAGRRMMDDGKMHAFVTQDYTLRGKPGRWGQRVADAYKQHLADKVVAEVNNGGDMVESTIKNVENGTMIKVKQVRASRGKMTRAEPVQMLYAQHRVHHVGEFEELESQMVNWIPGMASPDNLDAMVWAITDLLLGSRGWARGAAG